MFPDLRGWSTLICKASLPIPSPLLSLDVIIHVVVDTILNPAIVVFIWTGRRVTLEYDTELHHLCPYIVFEDALLFAEFELPVSKSPPTWCLLARWAICPINTTNWPLLSRRSRRICSFGGLSFYLSFRGCFKGSTIYPHINGFLGMKRMEVRHRSTGLLTKLIEVLEVDIPTIPGTEIHHRHKCRFAQQTQFLTSRL